MIVSLKDTSVMYIGETNNIVKRLTEHNSGSKHTCSQIHQPWALLSYAVVGFSGSASKQKAFENIQEKYYSFGTVDTSQLDADTTYIKEVNVQLRNMKAICQTDRVTT